MGSKLYIGNLPFSATEDMLRTLFEDNGFQAKEVTIITDRITGQARGFGFVEMNTPEDAQSAIKTLDGSDFNGRTLKISEAREQERGGGGGGGGDRRRRGPGGGGERRFGGGGRGGNRDRDRW